MDTLTGIRINLSSSITARKDISALMDRKISNKANIFTFKTRKISLSSTRKKEDSPNSWTRMVG